MTITLPRIKSRFLGITLAEGVTIIQFNPNRALTAGSALRSQQAIRVVRSALKRLKNRKIHDNKEGLVAQIFHSDHAQIQQVVTALDQKLADFAEEPLTTKIVEEILCITSKERVRWSKDGRLPNTGRASFKRGQNRVNLFTYSPTVVMDLAKRPETIANWRSIDATDDRCGQR